MNICITGLNKAGVKVIAKKLSDDFGLELIDFDTVFEPFLLKTVFIPVEEADYLLKDKVNELLKSIRKQKDCVVAIGAELYLQEYNYRILKNVTTIAVLKRCEDDLENNLQLLLAKRCKFKVSSYQEVKLLIRRYC